MPTNHPDVLAHLAEIPGLATEVIATAYAPNPSAQAGRASRRPIDTLAPANLTVFDLLRTDPPGQHAGTDADLQDADSHLLWLLHEAQRVVTEEAEEAGWPLPDQAAWPNFAGLCDWLTAAHGFWDGNRLAREWVTDNVAKVHAALARQARVETEPRYRCNHAGTHGTKCGAILHLEAGGAMMRCENGHEISHWAAVRHEIELQQFPLAEVLRVIERHWQMRVPGREVAKKWAQRGILTPSGRNGVRKLYRVCDVRKVILDRTIAKAGLIG